ncbi:MAG: cyclic nucleotide-binding domain-containing protein [Armatimonadetes bacterium]|nr:cyclic nucleotide-binding domain-containing protein [Armatimonadota bacterium]
MRLPLTIARSKEEGAEAILAFLSEVPIFRDLAPEQLATLRDMAEAHRFPAGAAILREGETGDCLFVLTEGEVDITLRLTLETSRGEIGTKDKTLIRLTAEKHPFFGEMALLGTDVRAATVTAVTDCTALCLNKQDLLILEREHPAIAYTIVRHIAETLCQRVREQNRTILKLTTALSIALSR